MRLGVTEIRKINYALKGEFEIDFGDYSFYFFKKRMEEYAGKNSFSSLDEFLAHIYSCDEIEKNILEQLSVSENEMFRDLSMWEYLRTEIILKLKADLNPTVWFPDVSTGEELYSFLVLLYEAELLNKVKIVVTSSSSAHLRRLKVGFVNSKAFENNDINYKRFNGTTDFGAYFDFIDNKIFLKKAFFKNVSFQNHQVKKFIQINGVKLVMFRNKSIYYSGAMQSKVLKNISNNLIPGGILVIGAKENISNYLLDLSLEEINKYERIYKKVNR